MIEDNELKDVVKNETTTVNSVESQGDTENERQELIKYIISKVQYYTSINLNTFTLGELKTLKDKINNRSDLS